MENYNIYKSKTNFLITNSLDADELKLTKIEDNNFEIFGYCFLENDIVKNKKITKEQYNYIADNQHKTSGIFASISKVENEITVVVDPLIQYNIFYYIDKDTITISNSIFLISKLHNLKDPEDEYLFDNIAYKSPLRGLTVLKNVFTIQYDDIMNNTGVESYKVPLPIQTQNLIFQAPKKDVYLNLDYNELSAIYVSKLKNRAKILAEKFEEVHIQLTGGADSRLVLSSLLDYKNIHCYVYGDGNSQNRLCYESLVKSLNLNRSETISFAGTNINSNTSVMFRALHDTSCRKFNNLNTYMNSDNFVSENKCKITGYYGANVCGGVSLPPFDTTKNIRTKSIASTFFQYHDYVKFMKNKYKDFRPTAFKDVFYLNNRGQSHYAIHSIADNLKSNSFDILYDPINLELVKKCPYTDSDIDRNAISIDLIYLINKKLALFPYDDRQIPKYRHFDNIPLINCFDGLKFANSELSPMNFKRPNVNIDTFDLLNKGNKHTTVFEMLSYSELQDFFKEYDFLEYLKKEDQANASILLFYILSTKLLKNLDKIEKGLYPI